VRCRERTKERERGGGRGEGDLEVVKGNAIADGCRAYSFNERQLEAK